MGDQNSTADRAVFIYDLSDPITGCVRYIGKSVDPSARLAAHIRDARKGDTTHCRRWIDGLLKKGLKPILGIVETASLATSNEVERYWIGCLRSYGANLTNRTPGGDGQSVGYKPSPESIAKMVSTVKGRKRTPEQRAAMKEAFNRPDIRARRSEITKTRMADPVLRAAAQRGRTGIPVSEDSKAKISASWTPERKAKHAAEKSAMPFDERWRAQLKAALAVRWEKYRKDKNAR